MLFLTLFILLILSQLLFSYILFQSESTFVLVVAWSQLIAFTGSTASLFFLFKNRGASNYKLAFSVFGLMITSGIPLVFFFIPGTVFLLTGYPIFLWLATVFATAVLIAFVVGILHGRWNWKAHRISLKFHHLPESANGVKIVQISDIHVGSFFDNHKRVLKAVNLINNLEPDYVVFTGDLVNNKAEEMEGWDVIFQQIRAKKGKFSILGNHDYGDYVHWESKPEKHANLQELICYHERSGFLPLLNDAIELQDGFWLLGVENWGRLPFRQSGKLYETLDKVPENSFKLLLSHDPTHFDLEIRNTNIDLTLSGHTHGMQFGIERFGIRWSPVKYYYKRWAGLYQEGDQYLYVNRGFGYLGFPGRVGIYPEITLFVLDKG
jgi:predicted MPP superfamily phosphohydrolase